MKNDDENTQAGSGCPDTTCSRLFLIRGVPGSGKTTYADAMIAAKKGGRPCKQ